MIFWVNIFCMNSANINLAYLMVTFFGAATRVFWAKKSKLNSVNNPSKYYKPDKMKRHFYGVKYFAVYNKHNSIRNIPFCIFYSRAKCAKI